MQLQVTLDIEIADRPDETPAEAAERVARVLRTRSEFGGAAVVSVRLPESEEDEDLHGMPCKPRPDGCGAAAGEDCADDCPTLTS